MAARLIALVLIHPLSTSAAWKSVLSKPAHQQRCAHRRAHAVKVTGFITSGRRRPAPVCWPLCISDDLAPDFRTPAIPDRGMIRFNARRVRKYARLLAAGGAQVSVRRYERGFMASSISPTALRRNAATSEDVCAVVHAAPSRG